MRVQDMVEAYLKENGFDGLYSDFCACDLTDLACCGEFQAECVAGVKMPCDCGDHDYHIGPRQETDRG